MVETMVQFLLQSEGARRRSRTLCFVMLLFAWPSAVALAQPKAWTKERAAKQLFERGETLYRMGKFKAAAEAYRRALEHRRRPSIIFNLAQCHRQLGDLEKALFYYRLFAADWARKNPGKTMPYAKEVALRIKVLEEQILAAKLKGLAKERRSRQSATSAPSKAKPQKKRAYLRVAGAGALDVQLFVDGVHRANAPLPPQLRLEPGMHVVELRRPGYRPFRRSVDARAGVATELRVTFKKLGGRNGWWLAAAIASGLLAAGAEAFALWQLSKANEHYAGTEAYDTDRKRVILGHGLAAGFGVCAVAATFFYIFSAERPPALEAPKAAQTPRWSPRRPLTIVF